MLEEVKSALQSLPSQKATGSHGLPTEIRQVTGEESVKVLTEQWQQIWKTKNYHL